MNKEKLFNYFKSNFEVVESTNGWYRLDNPFELKKGKTMAVNFSYNRIICHRSGYKSSINDFLRIYTNKDYKEVFEMVEKYTEVKYKVSVKATYKKSASLPDYFFLIDESAPLQKRAFSYLSKRGIDMDFLVDRSLGFCNQGDWFGRIIIPFMNPQLEYYVGRDFIGQTPKYKNPKKEDVGVGKSELFYNEAALNGDKIYLTEGVFDALSCGEKGVASLGWKLSFIQRSKLKNCNADIYIVPDKGFYQKALITAKDLLPKNVFITNLDGFSGNDVNDLGGIDELTFKEVKWVTN